jgi:microcystin degradation protein MlrC
VGAEIDVSLGGSIDRKRFTPMQVTARVRLLSDGQARLETMRTALDAGPSAVLTFGNFTVVVLSKSVSLFDRAMYYASGCNPMDYDLIVVKSPHTERHMFDDWAEKTFNIDAPGATSANLKSLGHVICARPIYPLDPDVEFEPKAVIYRRGG